MSWLLARGLRLGLVALFSALALAALAGFCVGLFNARHFFSVQVALLLVALLVLAALSFRVAIALQRARNPLREGKIAAGVAIAGISSLVSLGVAERVVSRVRPALTYDRAVQWSPDIFRTSEILPFELKPGYDERVYMWEADADVHFRVNRHGYRGPDFALAKAPDIYRILLLGDSFAVNSAVPEGSVHTDVLARSLQRKVGRGCRVEVINAGYADGFSPDSYLAYLLQKGFDLKPDLVLMQYFVLNDFKDLLETEVVEERGGLPWRVRSRYRHVDGHGRLRRTRSLKYAIPLLRDSHLYLHTYDLLRVQQAVDRLIPVVYPNYAGSNFSSNSYGITRHHAYAEAHDRPAVLQRAFEQSLVYVRQVARECAAREAHFGLFIVPSGIQMSRDGWQRYFDAPAPENWENPNPQVQIAAALEGDGIAILDPLARFRERARRETLYLEADQSGHWSRVGNAVAAEAMLDFILNRQGAAQAALFERCSQ